MARASSSSISSDQAPPPKKKMSRKKKAFLWGGAILLVLIVLGLIPYSGTINYGICKVFVERIQPYPQSVKYIKVEEQGSEETGFLVTMYYKRTDAFGDESMNSIVCKIKRSEDGKPYLDAVDMNGKNRKYPQEFPEYIRKFNIGMEAILQNPPDLTLPYVPSEEIKDYKDIP